MAKWDINRHVVLEARIPFEEIDAVFITQVSNEDSQHLTVRVCVLHIYRLDVKHVVQGKIRTHLDLLSIPQLGGGKCQNVFRCCYCCLHIKNRADLYSVPSNIVLVQLTQTPSVVTG